VIVNGQVVVDAGKHTGAKPGQVLRGPGVRLGSPVIGNNYVGRYKLVLGSD